MKRLRDTKVGRYVVAISATVHPVRAIFEVCGTLLFAVPFVTAFAMTRAAPFYLYLVYPLLFLVSHFVWFRLPSVERRMRWLLFSSTLTVVAALGAGFIYWSYREAASHGERVLHGLFSVPHWVSPTLDVDFPTAAVYFLVPAAAGAVLYCLLFGLFLRLYARYRAEEHRRRSPPDGKRA
jgi:hypothetical protein